MAAFGPIIILLLIAAFSLLVVRVGATALTMTGLSSYAASFQSLSAFSVLVLRFEKTAEPPKSLHLAEELDPKQKPGH